MDLIRFLIYVVSIFITAYILPGVHIGSIGTAFVVAIVLGILNFLVKPLLIILTLPINILTLGLFTLIINAILILLVSRIVPGFTLDSFLWAIIFSIVLSLIFSFLSRLS
jgi:putative membrane protein